jgi:hypothetical protein
MENLSRESASLAQVETQQIASISAKYCKERNMKQNYSKHDADE